MDKRLALGGLKTMDTVAGGAVSVTPIHPVSHGTFLGDCVEPRRHRDVRRDVVLGGAAHVRIRGPHGAWGRERDLLGMVAAQGLKLVFIGIGSGVVLARCATDNRQYPV